MRTLILLALVLSGCLREDPVPRFTPAWNDFDPSGSDWVDSQQALLVSDCQFHNPYSRALAERNLTAKSAITTAIRSPQLDLFATDVLKWILKNGAGDARFVIHLGDAMDLSCDGEFKTFVEVMGATDLPWFLTPGNHDAYYFGNYHPQKPEGWEEACHGSGKPVTKDRFLRLYVAALIRQQDPSLQALAAALGLAGNRDLPVVKLSEKVPLAFEWKAPEDTPGHLRRICWKADEERPWRSFILQSVDGSSLDEPGYSVRVLLMDSCQYARRPRLVPNGWKMWPLHSNCGSTGEMLPDQLRKARAWIDERRAWGKGFVIMHHHPFNDLAPRSRASLGWLLREYEIPTLVTSHTHKGFFAHHDLGGDTDHLELNIGSTTDWPMEWRTLKSWVNPERKLAYIKADRFLLVDVLRRQGGYFDPDWALPQDAPDDYRKYKKGAPAESIIFDYYWSHHLVPYWITEPTVRPNRAARDTELQIKQTLLWTYLRLIDNFPTDPAQEKVRWPAGCKSDKDVEKRIRALVPRLEGRPTKAEQNAYMDKRSDLLAQLAKFEQTRTTRDPETGESLDDVRARYKISQAVWASRYEKAKGRQLRVEDELIRIGWDKDEKIGGK
jgi:hypothetical protein